MKAALTLACCLLASSASALPVWPDPPPCHCEWKEEIPPPNMEPDPPQSYGEWLEDLSHEPPPTFALVCPIPPTFPPVEVQEPATGVLLALALIVIWGRR